MSTKLSTRPSLRWAPHQIPLLSSYDVYSEISVHSEMQLSLHIAKEMQTKLVPTHLIHTSVIPHLYILAHRVPVYALKIDKYDGYQIWT